MNRNGAKLAFVALLLLGVLGVLAWHWTSTGRVARTIALRDGGTSTAGASDILAMPADPAARAAVETLTADTESIAVDAAASKFNVRGRVVDANRFPAGGVRVSARLEPAHDVVLVSAADGTFVCSFPAEVRQHATHVRVWATSGDALAVARVVALPGAPPDWPPRYRRAPVADTNDFDVGTLTLGPAVTTRVTITAAGAPAAGAHVEVACGIDIRPLAQFVGGSDGVVELPPLPAGFVRLDAELRELTGAAKLWLPDERAARIELAPRRELALDVVDFASGAPLAGARVTVERMVNLPAEYGAADGFRQREPYGALPLTALTRTANAEGRAVLHLPPNQLVRISVFAEGHHSGQIGGDALKRIESPHRVPLGALELRTVRWPIIAGEKPVPAEGTPLALRSGGYGDANSPLRVAYVADAHVVVEGASGGFGRLFAETPSGDVALLSAHSKVELGEPVSFVRARKLDVRVREAAGAPVAGASVRAWTAQGNLLTEWKIADGEGRVTFDGLWAEAVELRACEPGEESDSGAIALVDLTTGDAQVDLVFPARALVRAQIRLDGVARLPARYEFDAPARVVEELPDAGEVRVRTNATRLGTRADLALRVPGFLPQLQSVVLGGTSESVVVFDLERAHRIVADVVLPPDGRAVLVAECWDDSANGWSEVRGLSRPNGANGRFQFEGLSAGKYQLRELWVGFTSAPFELDAAHPEVQLTVDLSRVVFVAGRVEVPAGVPLDRARVVVEGLRDRTEPNFWFRFEAAEPRGRKLETDGSFRIAVPLDQEITVRAWHPWLVPAEGRGEARVRGGRDGIVLALEARGEVRVLVTNSEAGSSHIEALRVAAFRGSVGREPVQWFHAPVAGGLAHFGGLQPGTWTLWVEAARTQYPPRVLSRVEIGAGSTELLPFAFERGSNVVLRLQLPPGDDGRGLKCVVTGLDQPFYERNADDAPDGTRVARGCAAGRHRLRITRSESLAPPIERELELDGVHDVTVDIDLR
jgi:hypothetical protein